MTAATTLIFLGLIFSIAFFAYNSAQFIVTREKKYVQWTGVWTMVIWLAVIQIIAADIPS